MRVCFLLPRSTVSGGAAVVRGHAERLGAHGFEVAVAEDAAGAAAGGWDVAVATWWETAPELFRLDARARVLFLQSMEHRFYLPGEFAERHAAELAYTLPVHYLVVAGWMREMLCTLRPDALCRVVRNGLDIPAEGDPGGAGAEASPSDAPLRILVDGHPELWFKGVEDAVAAVGGMRNPAVTTLLAPAAGAPNPGFDEVVGGLDRESLGRLYARHDVVLKLSRVEGFGMVPLEAFRLGTPCVVTPYTGHEEYLRHGQNGLVVGFDDREGTSAALDRLAADRAFLETLSAGALSTAADWPAAEASTAALAAALRELVEAPPPDPAAATRALQSAVRRHTETLRFELMELAGSRVHLARQVEEAVAWAEDAERRIREIKESRAYRAAIRARAAASRIRGRPGGAHDGG